MTADDLAARHARERIALAHRYLTELGITSVEALMELHAREDDARSKIRAAEWLALLTKIDYTVFEDDSVIDSESDIHGKQEK